MPIRVLISRIRSVLINGVCMNLSLLVVHLWTIRATNLQRVRTRRLPSDSKLCWEPSLIQAAFVIQTRPLEIDGSLPMYYSLYARR